MYRIAIKDIPRKKSIRESKKRMASAVEVSKQRSSAIFVGAKEVGKFGEKVSLGTFLKTID